MTNGLHFLLFNMCKYNRSYKHPHIIHSELMNNYSNGIGLGIQIAYKSNYSQNNNTVKRHISKVSYIISICYQQWRDLVLPTINLCHSSVMKKRGLE